MSEIMLEGDKRIGCPGCLYAIRDCETGRVIWNARGSAYKNKEDVERKLARLHKQNPEKNYAVIGWGKCEIEDEVYFVV